MSKFDPTPSCAVLLWCLLAFIGIGVVFFVVSDNSYDYKTEIKRGMYPNQY